MNCCNNIYAQTNRMETTTAQGTAKKVDSLKQNREKKESTERDINIREDQRGVLAPTSHRKPPLKNSGQACALLGQQPNTNKKRLSTSCELGFPPLVECTMFYLTMLYYHNSDQQEPGALTRVSHIKNE